jgi:hypothetical protein
MILFALVISIIELILQADETREEGKQNGGKEEEEEEAQKRKAGC